MFKKYIEITKDYFSLVDIKNKYLIMFTIIDIINVLLSLLIPYYASSIVDALTDKSYEQALIDVLLLASIFIINRVGSLATNWCYASFFKETYADVHTKLVNCIYEFDEKTEKKISKGNIINSTNIDILNIAELPSLLIELTVEAIKLAVIYFVFAKQNIFIAIFVLAIDLIYYNYSKVCNQKCAYYLNKQRTYADKLTGLISQIMVGLKDVKSLNFKHKLNYKLDGYREKWQRSYYLKRKYQFTRKTLVNLIVNLGKILLYLLLIYLMIKESITLTIFLLLISYYSKAHDSIVEIMNFDLSIKEEAVSLYRIKKIIENDKDNSETIGTVVKSDIKGVIEFKNICFKYDKNLTLKNVSFSSLANQVTTIVGKTGSGKTTILNLLMRLYKVDRGKILIDGMNIYDFSKKTYSTFISIVNQKTFMFDMSIRENLNLVDSNKKRQIEACEKVGIHDFIMSLPNGYNTVIGEDGSKISGGQKQLLSLARALLSSAEILLLDEVTSALDPKTTKKIIKLLKELKNDYTFIVVTHNRDLMASSDRIIVLKEGKVDSIGTHEELLVTSKTYQTIQKR